MRNLKSPLYFGSSLGLCLAWAIGASGCAANDSPEEVLFHELKLLTGTGHIPTYADVSKVFELSGTAGQPYLDRGKEAVYYQNLTSANTPLKRFVSVYIANPKAPDDLILSWNDYFNNKICLAAAPAARIFKAGRDFSRTRTTKIGSWVLYTDTFEKGRWSLELDNDKNGCVKHLRLHFFVPSSTYFGPGA